MSGRGCVAVAATPALIILAPIAAVRRALAVRRRGSTLRAVVTRSRDAAVAILAVEFDLPTARFGEVAQAIAGVAGAVAAGSGSVVGRVGLHADEEPSLTAFAPRRDPVAGRMLDDLMAGEAHRIPVVWFLLAPGCHLAAAIDPFAAFDGSSQEITGVLATGKAAAALRVEVAHGKTASRLRLAAYGPGRVVRGWLAVARPELRRLTGWESARAAAASPPSATVKTRFHR